MAAVLVVIKDSLSRDAEIAVVGANREAIDLYTFQRPILSW